MELLLHLKKLLSRDALVALAGLYSLQWLGSKIYRSFIYPYYVSPLRHLPGPKDHHFLIGQTLNQFRSGSPNEPYVSWMRQWPSASLIRYFTFGNSEAVLVTSLAAHHEILQDKCYSFAKPAFFRRLISDIVGLGLVFAEGDVHKSQRRALSGLFSLNNLRTLIPVFKEKARDLTGMFDETIKTNDGVVELVSVYSKIMLDIMGVFALGIELNNLSSAGNTPFHDCYHEVFEPDTTGQILVAINGFIPVRWLPLDANRRFVRANNIVLDYLKTIIRERIETLGNAESRESHRDSREVTDLLTYMVEKLYFVEGEDAWTEDDILDQIRRFLAAGHETTASSLVWATYVFMKHPDIKNRLRSEIMDLLSRNSDPDYNDMESLRYLDNFTRELLRVYCPAVSAPREALEDVVIQGVTIPKGTTVVMYPAVIQHNPTIWGANCDEFDPDRWDRLEGAAAEDPHAFAAFMHGPRMCIGKVMTVIEFKVIMIEMLSKFDFEAVDGTSFELLNPSPLLRPQGGMRVRVRRLE